VKSAGGEGPVREDETLDELGYGHVRIIQKARGYRFSVDAVLVADFAAHAQWRPNARIVDLGAGSGVIALLMAKRLSSARFTGVELQEEMAEMASRSVRLNDLASRVEIVNTDVRLLPRRVGARPFDGAVCNPPYQPVSAGRMNPTKQKAIARHEIKGSLAVMMRAARASLRPGGRVFTVFPASRIVYLVGSLRATGLGLARMRMVHHRPGSQAQLVLVEAVAGSVEGVEIDAPLILYDDQGEYSEAMARIYAF